jgi:hypothetical protein
MALRPLAILIESDGERSAFPFNSPHLLKMQQPPFRVVVAVMEVGGVEPPSSGAYRERLQVCRAYRVVEEGAADLRAFPPVSRVVSPRPLRAEIGTSLGQLRALRPLKAARPRTRLSLLTQRERSCRCWQLKVCRIRRSAAPPATRDPDRSSRSRCTPDGEALSFWIAVHTIRVIRRVVKESSLLQRRLQPHLR